MGQGPSIRKTIPIDHLVCHCVMMEENQLKGKTVICNFHIKFQHKPKSNWWERMEKAGIPTCNKAAVTKLSRQVNCSLTTNKQPRQENMNPCFLHGIFGYATPLLLTQSNIDLGLSTTATTLILDTGKITDSSWPMPNFTFRHPCTKDQDKPSLICTCSHT